MGKKDRQLQVDIACLNHRDNQAKLEQERMIANKTLELKEKELEIKTKEFETKDRVDLSKVEYLELLDYKNKYFEAQGKLNEIERNVNKGLSKISKVQRLPYDIGRKIMFAMYDNIIFIENTAGLKYQLNCVIDIDFNSIR